MISIMEELMEVLREGNISHDPEIRDYFSSKSPTYPLVAVDELDNSDSLKYLDKTYLSEHVYNIEIYTKDKSGIEGIISKRKVGLDIAQDIDSILKTKYGMTRVGTPPKVPMGEDNTVLRTILTYRCSIDNEHEITYR